MVTYQIHNNMTPLTGQIKGDLSTIHKGIEIGTDENLICLSGTMGHPAADIEDGTSDVTVKGNYNIDPCITQTIRFILSIFKSGSFLVQVRRDVLFSVAGSFSQTVTYKPSGLGAPPTYLETLDKLDQYSSAQYIPDRR